MKRKAISVTILLLIFINGIGYRFLNGDPGIQEQSKVIVTEYLQTKYPEQSFIIDDIGYYPTNKTYINHVISKDGDTQGNIDVRDRKIVNDELSDSNEE